MADKFSYTPLANKLGLKEGLSVLVYNVPETYGDQLGDITVQLHWLDTISKGSADFIHLFCTTEKELKESIKRYVPTLKETGMLWVSWPKADANVPTELDKVRITQSLRHSELVSVHEEEVLNNSWHAVQFRYPQQEK